MKAKIFSALHADSSPLHASFCGLLITTYQSYQSGHMKTVFFFSVACKSANSS